MVTGPNIIPSLAIVAAFAIGGQEYALQSFNAYIIAGLIVFALGVSGAISLVERVWSPLVLGSMVMMVALATASVGLSLIASFGASWPFVVGIGLGLLCGYVSIKGDSIFATIPVLIVITVGYAIFIATGKFDWGMVQSMPLFTYPRLFPFGWEIPPLGLIITMTVVHLFSAINLYGNVDGYMNIAGIEPGDPEVEKQSERRYMGIFGLLEGTLTGILGIPGYVSYGENLGILVMTKVAARKFIIYASIIFIILSFIGPMGGLMAAMPKPVAGAVLLGVASTLVGEGATIWQDRPGGFDTREIFIVSFAVFFSLGAYHLPQSFYNEIPNLVGTILKNPVIFVIILVMILEQVVFPEEPLSEKVSNVTGSPTEAEAD
jgi:NCS2 family nucleobase:cation symporter-2